MKLIDTISSKGQYKKAEIFRSNDWKEYGVKFFTNGQHLHESDYYTNTLYNAEETARHFCEL